jgi:hypothetical protein
MAVTPSEVAVPTVSGTPQAEIDNVQVTTSAGTVQRQVVSIGDPANGTQYANVNTAGGLETSGAGTTGTDYSVNKPSALVQLLFTIPANPNRNKVGIQSQWSAQVQILRDDGNGNNQTFLLLESGGAANTGGGVWESTTFKGRIRVYAASLSAQVAGYED